MTIKKNVQDAINQQINEELYSGYLYLAMSAYFEDQNLSGFASWMRKQAKEEQEHAMRFYKYLVERGGVVTFGALKQPKASWTSPLNVFEESYKHEQFITAKIDALLSLAEKEKDRATQSMLKWFVDEQVEEEAAADEVVQKLKMVKGSAHGILMLDQVLGKRE